MGGKKPVGDRPSRGSYHRRLHTSHQHQHQQPAATTVTDGVDSCESSDIPNYQDFSLFSAFSSSDRFGGILASKEATTNSSESDFPQLDGDASILDEVGTEEEGKGPTRTDTEGVQCCCAVHEQNSHLERSLQQLQETVFHMSQAMDRLNYEHSLIVQQLQHQQSLSWQQVMHMQLYGQSSQVRRHHDDMRDQHPQSCTPPQDRMDGAGLHPENQEKEGQNHLRGGLQGGQAEDERGREVAATREEIRRLKERLCTVEGRHKTVQGKVSQLDKLYGASSAAWGRRIKALLADQEVTAAEKKCSGNIRSNDSCCDGGDSASTGATNTIVTSSSDNESGDGITKDYDGDVSAANSNGNIGSFVVAGAETGNVAGSKSSTSTRGSGEAGAGSGPQRVSSDGT